MDEATLKALHRVIDRLEAIHKSSTPWNVRDQLATFITKLKTATNYKKNSEKQSETTSEEPMDTM